MILQGVMSLLVLQVQAVLLLLGGRELHPGVGAGASSSTPYSKVENSDES